MQRGRPVGANKARLLHQERQFQHVRDALGLGDDRGADRAGAVVFANCGGGAEDAKLAARLLAVGDEGRDQRTGRGQFPQQEFDALGFVHALVVEARDRGGEELGDGALVYVGVLPEIDRRQAEAEHVDRPLQRPQATPRQDRAAVGLERLGDGVEIGGELFDARVGRRVGQRMAERHDMIEVARGLGEARIHAGDGATVGLVAPIGGRVARPVGERVQFVANPNEAAGERKLAAELVQFVEIVVERARALEPRRLVEHAGGYVWVAVPVAADPGANAQEGGNGLLRDGADRASRARPRLSRKAAAIRGRTYSRNRRGRWRPRRSRSSGSAAACSCATG